MSSRACRRVLRLRKTCARPSVAPTNSPTTAPITASAMATFKPTNTNGSDAGNRTLTNCCSGEAESERARSTNSAGVDFNPVAVLITIGKKQMSTTMAILGPAPKPIQMTSSGAIATATGTPTAIESPNPSSVSRSVVSRWPGNRWRCRISSFQTSFGVGTRNGFQPKTIVASHHSPTSATIVNVGRRTRTAPAPARRPTSLPPLSAAWTVASALTSLLLLRRRESRCVDIGDLHRRLRMEEVVDDAHRRGEPLRVDQAVAVLLDVGGDCVFLHDLQLLRCDDRVLERHVLVENRAGLTRIRERPTLALEQRGGELADVRRSVGNHLVAREQAEAHEPGDHFGVRQRDDLLAAGRRAKRRDADRELSDRLHLLRGQQ